MEMWLSHWAQGTSDSPTRRQDSWAVVGEEILSGGWNLRWQAMDLKRGSEVMGTGRDGNLWCLGAEKQLGLAKQPLAAGWATEGSNCRKSLGKGKRKLHYMLRVMELTRRRQVRCRPWFWKLRYMRWHRWEGPGRGAKHHRKAKEHSLVSAGQV